MGYMLTVEDPQICFKTSLETGLQFSQLGSFPHNIMTPYHNYHRTYYCIYTTYISKCTCNTRCINIYRVVHTARHYTECSCVTNC